LSIFSGDKVNPVDAFGRSRFKIPSSFQKRQENQKKINEKGNFYAKWVLDKLNFGFWRNSKQITVRMKFSMNFNTQILYW